MPLAIGSIVWGVKDVPRAVEFWCAALHYKPLRDFSPSDDWAILIPIAGREYGPQMAIDQITSEAKVSAESERYQRHHLDLYAEDQTAEVERLLELGATRVEREYPEGADYVVLADPEGNHFCVIDKGV